MTENENLSDLYYERLSSTTNPGTVLARFMGELIDRPINKSHIIMMNKMVKNYGTKPLEERELLLLAQSGKPRMEDILLLVRQIRMGSTEMPG